MCVHSTHVRAEPPGGAGPQAYGHPLCSLSALGDAMRPASLLFLTPCLPCLWNWKPKSARSPSGCFCQGIYQSNEKIPKTHSIRFHLSFLPTSLPCVPSFVVFNPSRLFSASLSHMPHRPHPLLQCLPLSPVTVSLVSCLCPHSYM